MTNLSTTQTEIVKLVTDNSKLIFVGFKNDEEYYQEVGVTGGWSFKGLRPNTEDELRKIARDTDISEYCTIPDFLSNYIDHERFADDMEADWEDRHDVQATRVTEDGETLYLGFGSGTDAKRYFATNNIKTYTDYCNHFEYVGLTEKQFKAFAKKYAGIK